MALKECTECGRVVSDMAVACPACGYPIAKRAQNLDHSGSTNTRTSQTLSLVATLVGVLAILFFAYALNPSEQAHRAKLRGAIAEAHPVASIFGAAHLGALDVRYSDGIFMSATFRGAEVVTFGVFGVVVVVGLPLA